MMVADLITFGYHYPRQTVMFKGQGPQGPTSLHRAGKGWAKYLGQSLTTG